MNKKYEAIEAQVRDWLTSMVVGLGLCPFAARPVDAGLVRVMVTPADTPEALLQTLHAELSLLDAEPANLIETTLVVVPEMFEDFLDYNDFLDLAEDLLEQFGWVGDYQMASFHPDYQFVGTDINDAQNFSNRSPWPIIHLLREASVETAISHYPDTDAIVTRNEQTLNRIGPDELARRLAAWRR